MAHLAASASASASAPPVLNPNPDADEASCSPPPLERRRSKVVVVVGATGAGKSRLAVDLAGHLAGVEVVSADSMQVYLGFDALTNKVPLHEQIGVLHHLLGVIDPSVEFTCRDFLDHAVPIMEGILDRSGLPVIVGGTNFYIQALVSPFLFGDMTEDMQGCALSDHLDEMGLDNDDEGSGYERLKEIDPDAAQRIHPNNHRKIKRYLELYATTGALPSDLFQGEAAEARKFAFSFNSYFHALRTMLHLHDDKLKNLLHEAVSQLKANTRGLVRRQRQRLHWLNKYFGWNLHHIDATKAFYCTSSDSWHKKVIEPCVDIVKRFLSTDATLASTDSSICIGSLRVASRELCTQYVCEACNNRVLGGAHEWSNTSKAEATGKE